MPSTLVFAQESTSGGGTATLLFYAVLAVAFWFLFVRPQRKRQAALKAVQETLEVGTEVRTLGGIHGRVVEISEDTVVLEIEVGRLKIDRRGVSAKVEQGD